MDLDEAKDAGAMAMFGESTMSVRTVGSAPIVWPAAARTLSVQATSDAGSSARARLRRVCAASRRSLGRRRWQPFTTTTSAVRTAALLKTSPAKLGERIQGMQARLKDTEAELSEPRSQLPQARARICLVRSSSARG